MSNICFKASTVAQESKRWGNIAFVVKVSQIQSLCLKFGARKLDQVLCEYFNYVGKFSIFTSLNKTWFFLKNFFSGFGASMVMLQLPSLGISRSLWWRERKSLVPVMSGCRMQASGQGLNLSPLTCRLWYAVQPLGLTFLLMGLIIVPH